MIDFEEDLTNIIIDLDRQLEILNTDENTFHNSIIEIIGNNPNSKELVQFIVSINDKIETKNDILKDVLSDSLKTLILKKIEIFKQINESLNELQKENNKEETEISELHKMKKKIQKGTTAVTSNISNNRKSYIFAFFGILLLIAFLIFPDKVILLVKMYLSSKGV